MPPAPARPSRPHQFICGHRLAEVRDDLELSASRFIEIAGVFSEAEYLAIESLEVEAHLDVLDRVAKATGASLDWLKHGEGAKYPEMRLRPTEVRDVVRTLGPLRPKPLLFILERERFRLGVIAFVSPTLARFANFHVTIDFWSWFGDHHYIPDIHRLFDILHRAFEPQVFGAFVSADEFDRLSDGAVHPNRFRSRLRSDVIHWADDIRDFQHLHPIAEHYREWYGEWFVKVQDAFRQAMPDFDTRQRHADYDWLTWLDLP